MMFSLLLIFTACDSVFYPEIVIGTPSIKSQTHTKRTFRSLTAATPYILTTVQDQIKAQAIIDRLKIVDQYSIDINTMFGEGGNQMDRNFGRDHFVISIKRNDDGRLVTNFATLNITCSVHAEKITTITTVKKYLFGLIKKKSDSVSVSWRPLKASEIDKVYQRMNDYAADTLQNIIAKVKE